MFEEKPASKVSLTQRKPICGVGINDAPYSVNAGSAGSGGRCPYYQVWVSMLKRAYSTKLHERHPTYRNCSVDKEWHSFMNFRKWMEKQDWEGKQLDKDLLVIGNKVYSKATCKFIPASINNLLTYAKSSEQGLPHGVSYHKGRKKYIVNFRKNRVLVHLGYFCTQELAYEQFVIHKTKHIREVAQEQEDLEIKDALIRHAKALEDTLVDRTEQEEPEQERLGV